MMTHRPEKSPGDKTQSARGAQPRRNILVALAAMVVGGVVSIVPLIPGLSVFLAPLRQKKSTTGRKVRITTLAAVPADGQPHRFQVVDIKFDAWNKYPPEDIDAVYLLRSDAEKPPRAFLVTCPHLGCAVDFKPTAREYQCPCHTSAFGAIDGEVLYEPSPRGLDELDVEIRNGTEVWIVYKKYQIGVAKKVEV